MKKLLPLALACVSAGAFAEPTVYGKANVSFQLADEGDESVTELKSNASRLGVKGKLKVEGDLDVEGFYKFEYETAVDDGDEVFKQRNIFVGIRGGWGAIKGGHYDTPLKVAQKKVDLFNDLEGDIKNVITVNDNRSSNQVNYTTPDSLPVTVSVSYLTAEDETIDDGISASVAYENSGIYLALAVDKNVEAMTNSNFEESDVLRLVGQFNFGDFQIGALLEDMDRDGTSTDAAFVSLQYKLGALALKAQAGNSDISSEGGQTFSIGGDYKLAKNLKTFVYYTSNTNDLEEDEDYLGVGTELKF